MSGQEYGQDQEVTVAEEPRKSSGSIKLRSRFESVTAAYSEEEADSKEKNIKPILGELAHGWKEQFKYLSQTW